MLGQNISMLPTVSIIIPAYNAEKHISLTLDSVFNQTYPKELLEIIVINDGSTDETLSVLEKYNDTCTIIHKDNGGVSLARNKGIDHAKGEFIQFLDADDLLSPDKLEIQINQLIQNDADVAYGNWQRFVEKDNIITITETIERKIEGDQEIAIFTDFWCPPAAILYSKRIVDKIGGFKTWLPMVEDARYFLDAAIIGAKFVYTPTVVAQYRTGNHSSLSSINQLKFVECCYKNAISVNQIWKEDYFYNIEKKKAIINCIRYCITSFSTLDNNLFKNAVDGLLEIEPKYIPEHGMLRLLTKIIGYKNAEQVAKIKRRFTK